LAITCTALLGCAFAALVCVALAPWTFERIDRLPQGLHVPTLFVAYVAAGCVVQAGGIVAIRARYVTEEEPRDGTRRIWLSMVGGALLALSLTVSIAAAADFSTASGTVLLEILAATVCFAFSVYLGATWWCDSRGERRATALR
jgi:hypothetical protein